jgi:hypothetical protein
MAAKAHKPSSTSMTMGSCNLVSILPCMRFFIPNLNLSTRVESAFLPK